MFGETLGGDKALSATLAFVRFIVIHLLVILQVSDPRETRPTVAAFEKAALGVS